MFLYMLGNVVATLLAVYAFAEPLDWQEAGIIWLYDLVALFIVDFTKMAQVEPMLLRTATLAWKSA